MARRESENSNTLFPWKFLLKILRLGRPDILWCSRCYLVLAVALAEFPPSPKESGLGPFKRSIVVRSWFFVPNHDSPGSVMNVSDVIRKHGRNYWRFMLGFEHFLNSNYSEHHQKGIEKLFYNTKIDWIMLHLPFVNLSSDFVCCDLNWYLYLDSKCVALVDCTHRGLFRQHKVVDRNSCSFFIADWLLSPSLWPVYGRFPVGS